MAQCKITCLFWVIISTVGCSLADWRQDPGFGGLPQKPEHVWVNVKDIRDRHYYVHWRVSKVTQPAGLVFNVSYAVRFQNKQCTDQPVTYSCFIDLHHGVDFDGQFQCQVKNVRNKYCSYNVSVIANNSFGEAESDSVFVSFARLPTPLPPLSFRAHATENQEIKLQWEEQQGWASYNILYTILFHANGESSNKTANVTSREKHTTLDTTNGIQAFQTYYLYINAELDDSNGSHSTSETIGPIIVHTPEGVPKHGPMIVNDTSHLLDDKSFRNITLKWESPTSREWLGRPGLFQIYYRLSQPGSTTNVTMHNMPLDYTVLNVTDTSLNYTVIPGLKSAEQYHILMKMCNTKKCSAAGEVYVIKALTTNKIDPSQPMPTALIVTAAVLGSLAVVTAALVGLYCWCKRPTRTPRRPGLSVYEIPPPCAPYEPIQDVHSTDSYNILHESQDSDNSL